MSNTILNSDLSTKLEERLNSLITNHLKIQEPHLNDSKSKKELNRNISSAMDVVTGLGGVLAVGVGVAGFFIAGRYGAQAINENLANLANLAVLAKGAGLTALIGTLAGAGYGLSNFVSNIKEKVNTNLGITTYSMTHKKLTEIEKDLGVEFKTEDLIKISSTLDEANIKQNMEKAISNVKVKNK